MSAISLSFLFNSHQKTNALSVGSLADHLDILLAPVGIPFNEANAASSAFAYKNNLYSVILGHRFVVSSHWLLRPYWGINLSDIKASQKTTYFGLPFLPADFTLSVQERSAIVGIGPLVGLSTVYNFFDNIGLIGDLGIGVLSGKLRSSYAMQTSDNRSGIVESKTQMSIFELVRAKLGLSYQLPHKNQLAGHITLGYQLTEYIGAAASHVMLDNTQDDVALHFFKNRSFAGPFLAIQINMLQ